MALVRVDPTATDFCLEDNNSCLGSALQLGTVEVDKGRPYTIPALTEIRVKLEDLGTGAQLKIAFLSQQHLEMFCKNFHLDRL